MEKSKIVSFFSLSKKSTNPIVLIDSRPFETSLLFNFSSCKKLFFPFFSKKRKIATWAQREGSHRNGSFFVDFGEKTQKRKNDTQHGVKAPIIRFAGLERKIY